MLKTTALYRYPIKSCQGHTITEATLDRFGIQQDRRWMLVDKNNRFVTQRQLAIMTQLSPQPTSSGIRIRHKNDSLDVHFDDLVKKSDVKVWGDTVSALEATNKVSQWISEKLGKPLTLVYMPDSTFRNVDAHYASQEETVSFADGFPILLISQASLDLLNSKLSVPIPMDRFRPNIVVDGCDAHEEDKWKKIQIGDIIFDVSKPCSRCIIPSIDQLTGDKNPKILDRLREYRLGSDKQIYFGQNLLYQTTGKVSVGDSVTVLA